MRGGLSLRTSSGALRCGTACECCCSDVLDTFGAPTTDLYDRFLSAGWRWTTLSAGTFDTPTTGTGYLVHDTGDDDFGVFYAGASRTDGTFRSAFELRLTLGPDADDYGATALGVGDSAVTNVVLVVADHPSGEVVLIDSSGDALAEGVPGGPGDTLRLAVRSDGSVSAWVNDTPLWSGTPGLDLLQLTPILIGQADRTGSIRVASSFEIACVPSGYDDPCEVVDWGHCYDAEAAITYEDEDFPGATRVDTVPDGAGAVPLQRDINGDWGTAAGSVPRVPGPIYTASDPLFGGYASWDCDVVADKANGTSVLSNQTDPLDTSTGGYEGGSGIAAPYWGVAVVAGDTDGILGTSLLLNAATAAAIVGGVGGGVTIAPISPVGAMTVRAGGTTDLRSIAGFDTERSFMIFFQVDGASSRVIVIDETGAAVSDRSGTLTDTPMMNIVAGFVTHSKGSFVGIKSGAPTDAEIAAAIATLTPRIVTPERSVSDLSLVALYEPDSIVDGSEWPDTSGNSRTVVQGTPASRPAVNVIGNEAAFDFDGSDDFLRLDLGAVLNVVPVFMLAIVSPDTADDIGIVVSTNESFEQGVGQWDTGAGVWRAYTGGTIIPSPSGTVNANVPVLLIGTSSFSSSVVIENGLRLAAGTLSVNDDIDNITIGAVSSGAGRNFDGQVSYVLISNVRYNGTAAAELASPGTTQPFPMIHEQLLRRYGLT